MRVYGAANDLDVLSFELSSLVVELADLGGAHESEISRPEEKDDVLAAELLKADFLELALPPGLS